MIRFLVSSAQAEFWYANFARAYWGKGKGKGKSDKKEDPPGRNMGIPRIGATHQAPSFLKVPLPCDTVHKSYVGVL